MAQGLERRAQATDNLRGADAVNPTTRSVPSMGSVPTPRTPDTSYGAQIANQVGKFASDRLASIQAKRQERSTMDGQIAAMQGQSFESVEMGGDKFALEGYRAVTATTMAASLLRAQENDINNGAYEQDPDTYRATLVGRIDAMTADIPDARTRKMAQDQLMQQTPGLVDEHMKQNIAFKEQQNFDALSGSVDTLSRDNSSTGALIAFANGTSEATAGLSQERRRAAVVQGVVNAFTNGNPAAYAHLEAEGFFNTNNLTVSQIGTVNAAKAAFHAKMESEVNLEWTKEISEHNDKVTAGKLDPIVAAEQLAEINARHNRRTSSTQAGAIYESARAGVEFAEGTRGININAAVVSGDYALAARLMNDGERNTNIRKNQSMNPLLSNDGSQSKLTRSKATSNMNSVLSGPFARLQGSFGKELVINDAIAKAGTSREKSTKGSQHFHGNALDISTAGMSDADKDRLVDEALASGFTGIGFGRNIIHLDTGARRSWSYGNDTFGSQSVANLKTKVANHPGYKGPTHDDHANHELEESLAKYKGDVPRTLLSRIAGDEVAKNWDGNMDSLTADQKSNIEGVLASWNDDRPDPAADRKAAELNYETVRKQAALEVMEAMAPDMAENDELFSKGQRSREDWQNTRRDIFQTYGKALDSERINQESQMMRANVGDRITELLKTQENLVDLEKGVKLTVATETADIQRAEDIAAYKEGTGTKTLDEINKTYMDSILGAYRDSGSEPDVADIQKRAAKVVRESSEVVKEAVVARGEAAMISNAETGRTVGTLPKELQARALKAKDEEIAKWRENFQAENPDANPTVVAAMTRQKRVDYLADNSIVDPALQQVINNAANDRAWLLPSGEPNPRTVVALQNFTSILAANPDLAYQYVPDAKARGRMLGAAAIVQSNFPDREIFTDVDLNNVDDPVTGAFYEAVGQTGLTVTQPPTEEQTAERIAAAQKAMDSGNLTGTLFGGLMSTDVSGSLVPYNVLAGAINSQFNVEDGSAARSIDREIVNSRFADEVNKALEEIIPYMGATSNKGAATAAVNYVRTRGAVLGSNFVMPSAGEPSIHQMMFPGEDHTNTAAPNTAIVNWMQDPAVYNAKDEEGRLLNPRLAQVQEDQWAFSGPADYSVRRINGMFVADIVGYGSIVLPFEEIGKHYKANR